MPSDNLSALNTTRTNWHVKVRVTRMWQAISIDEVTLIGTHLVLLDSEDSHRHAYVAGKLWTKFNEVFKIGEIYEITNFDARDIAIGHRPVRNRLSIVFTDTTVVKHCEEGDVSIPTHKFEIVHLKDLYEVAEPFVFGKVSKFSTDIIGKFVNIQPVQRIKAIFGKQSAIFFNITDGRNSFKVTFWGEHLGQVESIIQYLKKKNPIVILAGIRPFLNNGTIEIGVTGRTKIFIDPEILEIQAFSRSLSDKLFESD